MSRDFSGYSAEELRDVHAADKFATGVFGLATTVLAYATGKYFEVANGLGFDVDAIIQSENKLTAVGSALATAAFGCITVIKLGETIESGQALAVQEFQEAQTTEAQTAEAQEATEPIPMPPVSE